MSLPTDGRRPGAAAIRWTSRYAVARLLAPASRSRARRHAATSSRTLATTADVARRWSPAREVRMPTTRRVRRRSSAGRPPCIVDLDTVLADHADDIVMFDVPPPDDGVTASTLPRHVAAVLRVAAAGTRRSRSCTRRHRG